MQQRCPGYHMNISETPAFYETDITDKNMSLERKMVSNISSFCICEMEDKEEGESSRNYMYISILHPFFMQ